MKYNISKIANEINTYDTYFIVGAGISMTPGMPNFYMLQNILWKVFDDEASINKLRLSTGSNEKYAKKIINDSFSIKKAFDLIEYDLILTDKFKKIFIEHSNQKCNSKFHKSLAKLLHLGKVKKVISMNWDNLLESAWHELYGTDIDSSVIIKPHGDVNKPNEKWTFPNSDGYISNEMKNVLIRENKKPLIIVIIGYSENDSIIKKNFIEELEKNNTVYRVNPYSDNSIKMDAIDFIDELMSNFEDQNSEWKYLNFDNQKDLKSIVTCNALSHLNAENTPRLPIFEKSISELKNGNILKITGPSGSGKTVASYQIAYEYHKKNYEIIYFNGKDKIQSIVPRFKTVAIIDNANNYPQVVNSLIDNANTNFKMIFVYQYNSIKSKNKENEFIEISSDVNYLYMFFKKHKRVLEKSIRENCSTIDEFSSYDSLINRAKKEKTPYKFMYVVKGTQEAIKDKISDIKSKGYYDIYAFIAMYQVLNTDLAISISELKKFIEEFSFLPKYNRSYLSNILNSSNRSFLFNHLQEAYLFLKNYFSDKDFNFRKFKDLFDYSIANNLFNCFGLGNFIDSFKIQDFRFEYNEKLILIDVLYKNRKNEDGLLYAINEIIWAEDKLLDDKKECICDIINHSRNKFDLYRIGGIINDLYNIVISKENELSKDLSEYYYDNIDFKRIAEFINNSSLSDLVFYSGIIERSSYALDDKRWNEFSNYIDKNELINKINNITNDEIWFMSNVCSSFSRRDNDELNISMMDKVLKLLKKEVVKVFSSLDDSFYYSAFGIDYFNGYIDDDEKYEKNRKAFVNNISNELLKNEIENIYLESSYNVDSLFGLIRITDENKFNSILSMIDFEKVAKACAYFIDNHNFDRFLSAFYDQEDNYCSKLLEYNENNIESINSKMCINAPRFCVEWVKADKKCSLFDAYIPSSSINGIMRIYKFDFDAFIILMDKYKRNIIKFIDGECHDKYDLETKKSFCELLLGIKDKLLDLKDYNEVERLKLSNYELYNKEIINNY